jgi:hypothetical protein
VVDVKNCKYNAQRCIEMANNSTDDKTQSMLFELAHAWTKLGDEIEASPSLRAAVSKIDLFTPGPSRHR